MSTSCRNLLRLLVPCSLAILAIALVGCAKTAESTSAAPTPAKGAMMAGSAQTSMMPGASAAPGAQLCAQCGGKGPGAVVPGTVKDEDGVQMMEVEVEDGYYTPNEFTVKAGSPVAMKFSGKVAGCIGMPTIKELDKKANFVKTGETTLDLGTLAAGTYTLTCGMGRPYGTITAQ